MRSSYLTMIRHKMPANPRRPVPTAAPFAFPRTSAPILPSSTPIVMPPVRISKHIQAEQLTTSRSHSSGVQVRRGMARRISGYSNICQMRRDAEIQGTMHDKPAVQISSPPFHHRVLNSDAWTAHIRFSRSGPVFSETSATNDLNNGGSMEPIEI